MINLQIHLKSEQLKREQQQVRQEAIELNQYACGNEHPDSRQYGG
jgi:hypothetical protein